MTLARSWRRTQRIILLAILILASAQSFAARKPRWASDRQHRVLIDVSPRELGGRERDEMPAQVEIDFEQLLRGAGSRADLSTLQVMRVDPETGEPMPYANNLFQDTPFDLPVQWHDAAIPDPFADRDRSAKSPWIARPGWGYYYEVTGDWKRGKLAWPHTQQGSAASLYAAYFDLLPAHGKPANPAPRGWIGDGSHRTAKVGKRSTGLYIPDCTMVDFNFDGLFDLLCGSSRGGVLWYENLGTKNKPRFAIARLLFQDDGRAIDPGFCSTPAWVDWDGDGKVDLLLGATKGWVYFYRNVGTNAQPRYHDQGPLQLDGHDLRPPASPVPEVAGPNGESIYKEDYEPLVEVADWDGDGFPDVLLGGYVTGRVFWYRNTGRRDGNGAPVLEDRGPLMADGKILDVGWVASAAVGDLDGDGDLDLIVGNWRKWGNESPPEIVEDTLSYFENAGTRKNPVLTMKPLPRIGKLPEEIATPSLADWDGDGDLDLMMSTQSGFLYLYENKGTPRAPKFDTRAQPLSLPWGNDPLPYAGDAEPLRLRRSARAPGVDLVGGMYVIESANAALPWLFRQPRSILPAHQSIDHRSWRGDDWQYTTVVDFDGDGRPDVLFGDYWGNVWFHRNLTSPENGPAFDTTGIRIARDDGKLVQVGPTEAKPYDFDTMQGPRTGVAAADFDGDGVVDLVVNDVYGHQYFCPRGPHRAEARVASQASFADLKRYAAIYVTDENGDGRPDLILSQLETHYLFRNLGAGKGVNGTPFAPAEILKLPVVPVIHGVNFISFEDMNGDGDRDLLIMSDHSYHGYFERSFLEHGYAEANLLGYESK